jgi:Tfp pilus assembly protein PilF
VDDQDLTTLNNYGLFLTELRRYHEAKTVFKRALHLDDTDTEIYINYGHLLYEMGEYEDAK